MPPSAVTEETPAVSNQPNSQFLPTDKNYLLTGEMPADTQEAPAASPEKKETDKPADTEDAPAASDSADTAAASAAAETQERKPAAQTRTGRTSESRWQKITRENRELREKLARAEGRAETSPSAQRDTQQTSQPAAEATGSAVSRPKIDDVDPKTGKPKYATYADYEAAKDDWLLNEGSRRATETSATTRRLEQMQQAERTLAEGFTKKLEPARKAHADFDAVALNEDLIIPRGSVTDGFLLDSEHAGEVLYYLGQHPEILEGFYRDYDPKTGKYVNQITPFAQARELTKIELQLSGKSQSSPARTITQAGRPPNQVSGKGTITPDAVEQAVKDQDQETYAREANARELARLKRK